MESLETPHHRNCARGARSQHWCFSIWAIIFAISVPAFTARSLGTTLPVKSEFSGYRGNGFSVFPDAHPPTTWDLEAGRNIRWFRFHNCFGTHLHPFER